MENKTGMIKFRIYPEELEALKKMCDQEKRKISEMMREVIREAAIRRGIEPFALNSNLIGFLNRNKEVKNEQG